MTEIRLRACPRCGGQPVALIMRQCGQNVVMIQCSKCGSTSGGVLFTSGKVAARSVRRDLLPDLAIARRQAAAAWNGGDDDGEGAEAAWPV